MAAAARAASPERRSEAAVILRWALSKPAHCWRNALRLCDAWPFWSIIRAAAGWVRAALTKGVA